MNLLILVRTERDGTQMNLVITKEKFIARKDNSLCARYV